MDPRVREEALAIFGQEIASKVATGFARHGDVTLRRDTARESKQAVWPVGRECVLLMAGDHGSHVAVGAVDFDETTRELRVGNGGALLVHTDREDSRHDNIALPSSSVWLVGVLRELDLTGAVRQVVD